MEFRAGVAWLTLALAVALLTPQPLTAQTLAIFDDFSSERIDPGRWAGQEHAVRYGSPAGGWSNEIEDQWTYHPEFSIVNTVVDRRVIGGRLRLQLRTRGGMHDNTMAPGHGRLALRPRVVNDVVTRVQAQVTVVAATAQPCRSDGESRTRAQLYAEVLRDTAGETVLFVTLSLQRSSHRGDRIVAVLSRCVESGCRVAEDLEWVVFNRSWTLQSAHSLTITHQPANDRVLVSVSGGGVAAEGRTLRYAGFAEEGPGSHFALRVENSPSNCPADDAAAGERVAVSMDARFDNVRVNASAVPAP